MGRMALAQFKKPVVLERAQKIAAEFEAEGEIARLDFESKMEWYKKRLEASAKVESDKAFFHISQSEAELRARMSDDSLVHPISGYIPHGMYDNRSKAYGIAELCLKADGEYVFLDTEESSMLGF